MLGLVLARARSRDERGKKRPQEGNCHPDNRNNEPTQDYSEKIKQNGVNLQKEKKTRSLIFDGFHKHFDVVENNCSSTRSQEQPKETVGQIGGVLD